MFRSQINPPRSFQRFSASDLATIHSSLATAPLTPFPATLSGKSQLIENPATLSRVVATLTRHLHLNPFVCHSYKKHGGWRRAIVNFFVAQTSACALLSHESPGTASALFFPRATSHASPITNSFRIRTYEKHTPNPFRIRTSKTQHLKPFRMNTSEKKPGGGPYCWPATP